LAGQSQPRQKAEEQQAAEMLRRGREHRPER